MFTLESFVRNERTPEGTALQYLSSEIIDNIGREDPGLDRPYRDDKGKVWVDVTVDYEQVKDKDGEFVRNTNGEIRTVPVTQPQLVRERRDKDLPVINITDNATVLRKDQWITLDRIVKETARKRMRAWSDLRASNTLSLDGMSTTILEWEKLTDVGEAIVDMDALSEGNRNAAPQFKLQGLPLPITHADFWLSKRFLAASRKGGGAFGSDRIRAAQAARRIGETIEQTLIGTQAGIIYGDDNSYVDSTPQVTGYTNHADRLTSTGNTAPDGTNGTTILTEWLAQREVLTAQNFFGPYVVYVSTNWDQFLDNEFKTEVSGTLRERLLSIEDVTTIRRLDYLTTDNTVLWVQHGELIEAVNGMEITTVQWMSKGGMQLNFKVMGIQVPRLMSVPVNTGTTGPATTGTADKLPVLQATV